MIKFKYKPSSRTCAALLLLTASSVPFGVSSQSGPSGLEGDILVIEANGPISAEARQALSKLLDPSSLEAFLSSDKKNKDVLKKLCGQCNDRSDIVVSSQDDPTGITVPIIRKPGWLERKNNYAVLPTLGSSEVGTHGAGVELAVDWDAVKQAMDRNAVSQVAVSPSPPLPQYKDVEFFKFSSLSSPETNAFESSISELGFAKQQIRFPESEAGREAYKSLITDGTVKTRRPIVKENDFEWLEHDVVTLDGDDICQISIKTDGDGNTTQVEDPNWPFNVETITGQLDAHQEVLESLNLSRLPASQVLIIDSGLGQKVYETKLAHLFMPDYQAFLFPKYYFSNGLIGQNAATCLYETQTINPSFGNGFPDRDDHVIESRGTRCADNRIDRIHPLVGQATYEYSPDHGTFVAILAAGGVDFLERYKADQGLIRLDVARITNWSSGTDNKTVETRIPDLAKSIRYAQTSGAHIINTSFRVSNLQYAGWLSDALDGYHGLVVAAAGNSGGNLNQTIPVFPASVNGKARSNEQLIVVGATQKDEGGNLTRWNNSSWSSGLVDIAAPGANIRSLSHDGTPICSSGTSAAAPVVTFTAAMLRTTGLTRPREIRRRILATAKHNPALKGYVNEARQLEIVTALDVFSDLVWKTDEPGVPQRGYLLPYLEDVTDETKYSFVGGAYPLCLPNQSVNNDFRRFVDLNALQMWKRESDIPGSATIWERGASTSPKLKCTVDGSQKMRFYDLETGRIEQISVSGLNRVVPSPYRAAIQTLYEQRISE